VCATALSVPAQEQLFCWNGGPNRFDSQKPCQHRREKLFPFQTVPLPEISRAHLIDADNRDPGRFVVWSHPAFANKSIYARNDHEIVCVSLAE